MGRAQSQRLARRRTTFLGMPAHRALRHMGGHPRGTMGGDIVFLLFVKRRRPATSYYNALFDFI
eukprot:5333335-Pyramimonas_sp.AAC.1